MSRFGSLPAVAALARLRDKYWFLPALAALVGLVAGIGLVALDIEVGPDWHGSRPEGARAMLSTIAGSTITVAGVVFSITLAAVTYASGQHGPRLLTNFARDRGNQLTLGIFIGTYVYCLIVLRTIRSAGEDSSATSFVPQIAVYGALALALASIGVLIYFFHHVTETIHINNVVARIGRKLIDTLRRQAVDEDSHDSDALGTLVGHVSTIKARRPGYIESIDHEELTRIASKQGIVVRLRCRPGDFVIVGAPLAESVGPLDDTAPLSEELRRAFAIGDRRTDLQDMRFGFDELTEIAVRALSPGINDPFTAIACIDWLTAALAVCEKSVAPAGAKDDGHAGLVRTIPLTFDDFLELSFGRLRQHAVTEQTVTSAALQALSYLAADATDLANRGRLLAERAALEQGTSR